MDAMITNVKRLLSRYPFIYRLLRQAKHKWGMRKYGHREGTWSPPQEVKQEIVFELARQFSLKTMIETGTYLGDMVYAAKDEFSKIYSIELDEMLFLAAERRFQRCPHIKIIHGDSGSVLPQLLGDLKEPCLFWLDAHYSGGITAKGLLETPILQEVSLILDHPITQHVILIDDAHCFTGLNNYPKIEDLRSLTAAKRPDYFLNVKDNIIRICSNKN
jgi:hypothetical protein